MKRLIRNELHLIGIDGNLPGRLIQMHRHSFDCVVTSLFSQKFKGTLEHTFTRNFSKK